MKDIYVECCGWCGKYYDPTNAVEMSRHGHHLKTRKSGLYGVVLFNGEYVYREA